MRKILSILFIVFIAYSCQMIFGEDDKLTMERKNYYGNELKLNGYYYHKAHGMIYTYFLFRNGLIFESAGSFKTEKWSEYEKKLKDTVSANKSASLKYNWGVFQIKESILQFEKWYPSERPYRVSKKFGRIINDSTFIIIDTINNNGEFFPKQYRYHYKRFENKVDSITDFID